MSSIHTKNRYFMLEIFNLELGVINKIVHKYSPWILLKSVKHENTMADLPLED